MSEAMSEARQAAERSAEKLLVRREDTAFPQLWDKERRRWADAIEAEIAPLLAAKECHNCDGTGHHLDADDQVHCCGVCRERDRLAEQVERLRDLLKLAYLLVPSENHLQAKIDAALREHPQ